MCIALVKKAGAVIENSVLVNCFENNSDGCGMAWIDTDRTIQVYKTLDYNEFIAEYNKVISTTCNESDMLIHFRIKTHGKVDVANCHPFVINDDAVFIHNGTISGLPTDPDKSDTWMFNETILQHLPVGWETNLLS